MANPLGKNPLKDAFFKKSKARQRQAPKVTRAKKEPRKKPAPDKRTAIASQKKAVITKQASSTQVVGCIIAGEYFGLDMNSVEEIVQMVEITELPKSPDFVDGIIGIRGRIVPVISLRKMLGFEYKQYNLNTEIVIATIGTKEIGLVVDRVVEIVSVQVDQILTPDEKTVPLAKFLSGIADLDGKLMLLLDLDTVLNYEQRALLKKLHKIPQQSISSDQEKRDKVREILHNRAVELRKIKIEDSIDKKRLITFSLRNEWYGLDINQVIEISNLLEIFYIPSTPGYIRGTINLRGKIVPVVNLKRFFDLPETTTTQDTCIIIVEYEHMKIGLIVDSISEVMELPVNLIQPPLVTLERIKADFLEGEAEWDSKLIGLLDLNGIVNAIRPEA
ncbi:MAG: chemotaxis protein CheW [candidate division WOR-3 bacterium]|nr:MAG: chemotaxis protein CheW [candidate division WOR-3 bacterium]